MKKLIIIAGVSAVLGAGAVGAAVAQAPAQAPADQRAASPPPGAPGVGMPDRSRDQGRRGMRGGLNGPLTAERQAGVAALFAQLDSNKDGRTTFPEFQTFQERQRVERQRRAFNGLSGGQDSVTLDQLTARLNEQSARQGGPRRGGGGRGR